MSHLPTPLSTGVRPHMISVNGVGYITMVVLVGQCNDLTQYCLNPDSRAFSPSTRSRTLREETSIPGTGKSKQETHVWQFILLKQLS